MSRETYASLQDIISSISTQLVDAVQYNILLDNADYVSRRIDNLLVSEVPYFLPYKETREIPIDGTRINSGLNTFQLDGNLLEQTTVTVNGQDFSSYASVYPATQYPIRTLRLSGCCRSWYDNCNDPCGDASVVEIAGIWGYRRRGGVRWKQVGTLHASINASVTAIAVDDLGAVPAPINADVAALSAGHLLKIGDEFMVKEYSATGQTVERNVNGTTAAPHTALDPVYVFQVEETMRRVVARQAGLLLARRGAYDVRNSNEVGTAISYPQDLLVELYGALSPYAN